MLSWLPRRACDWGYPHLCGTPMILLTDHTLSITPIESLNSSHTFGIIVLQLKLYIQFNSWMPSVNILIFDLKQFVKQMNGAVRILNNAFPTFSVAMATKTAKTVLTNMSVANHRHPHRPYVCQSRIVIFNIYLWK